METTDKLAVLIDADNAQPRIVDGLLVEIANYGTASVKRIYGDWTGPGLKGFYSANAAVCVHEGKKRN